MKHEFNEVLIDTDVLLEHLKHTGDDESDLEFLMLNYSCFTTVVNATELFMLCEQKDQEIIVENLLSAIKILGINYRYSKNILNFKAKSAKLDKVLISSVAFANKLPIVTYDVSVYENIGLESVSPILLRGKSDYR